MRTFLILLCVFCAEFLLGQSGVAPMAMGADGFEKNQDTTHIYRIKFLDGKTFEELNADSLNYTVKDFQGYNYSILHFKVVPKSMPEEIYEFYRVDDKKYTMMKYVGKNLIESGIIVNNTKSVETDTTILFDLFESKNIYIITYYYESMKTEGWIELDGKSRRIFGSYKNGKKHGVWYWWGGLCPSITYDTGKAVSYFCPNQEIILDNINMLFDKEYVRCYKQSNSELLGFYTVEEAAKSPSDCEPFQKLVFNKDGHFFCEGFENSQHTLKSGEGIWKINDENKMLFLYSTKEIFKFEIQSFGLQFLVLENLN